MDLLPEHTEDDKQEAKPEQKPDQKPDINQYFNEEYGPNANSDQKPDAKQAKPSTPKAFDIFSPNKTTPPSSGRPIIVSHKAMAKDTTVTGNKEILRQENREATAPPPEEHRQMFDIRKKVNLQPIGDGDSNKSDAGHSERNDSAPTQQQAEKPENQSQFDRPNETNQSGDGEHSSVESRFGSSAVKSIEITPDKQELNRAEPVAPSAAFSAPEHTDISPGAPDAPDTDELLIPAHTGGGYNEPVQDPEEKFNQFVVSHHRNARQKWLKKFGIVIVIVLAAAVAIGVVVWKFVKF